MSPIPSLRKGNYNVTLGSIGTETMDLAKFPPSFRITRNYGTGRSQLRHRGHRGNVCIPYSTPSNCLHSPWQASRRDHA